MRGPRPAPAFDLVDVGDGSRVRLASFQGKVVVLDFWATWCGPCIQEMPEYARFWNRNRPRGVEVVGVVSAGAPAYARAFRSGLPEPFPASTEVADGMAVRTPDPEALALVRRGVARIVEVEDGEVEEAMAALFRDTHNVAEGAGAAGLAGLLALRDQLAGKTVAVILSGSNIDAVTLRQVMNGEL